MPNLQQFSDEDYCYLTTTGRMSRRPHTIEIWFALNGQTLYMLSGAGGKADWVKNIQKRKDVHVRIKKTTFTGQGTHCPQSRRGCNGSQAGFREVCTA